MSESSFRAVRAACWAALTLAALALTGLLGAEHFRGAEPVIAEAQEDRGLAAETMARAVEAQAMKLTLRRQNIPIDGPNAAKRLEGQFNAHVEYLVDFEELISEIQNTPSPDLATRLRWELRLMYWETHLGTSLPAAWNFERGKLRPLDPVPAATLPS